MQHLYALQIMRTYKIKKGYYCCIDDTIKHAYPVVHNCKPGRNFGEGCRVPALFA